MKIPGLPQGVDVVRFGIAEDGDFEITMEQGKAKVTKGPRAGSTTQVIVKPEDGWAFRWDVREFCFIPVKLLTAPAVVTIMAKFQANTDVEQAAIQQAIEALKQVPGFQELITS